MLKTAKGAALLSLAANFALVAMKLAVGLYISSISVLADALDSGMDLVGAFVAVFAIRIAARPADQGHPYGHGKAESLSAIMEGSLISIAAIGVGFEAIRRWQGGAEVTNPGIGAVVMGVSLVINAATTVYLRAVSRITDSPALEAAAWHRASDIFTSLGVLVGLVIMFFTPWRFLDPIVAIGVAAFVLWTGGRLLTRAVRDLMDVSLPAVEEAGVRQVMEQFASEYVEFHGLRTRKSGSYRQIDFHMVLPRVTTVGKAHDLTDRVEAALEVRLPRSVTTIHVESCEVPEEVCVMACLVGREPLCRQNPGASHVTHAGANVAQHPTETQEPAV